jgi:hypothetical protein
VVEEEHARRTRRVAAPGPGSARVSGRVARRMTRCCPHLALSVDGSEGYDSLFYSTVSVFSSTYPGVRCSNGRIVLASWRANRALCLPRQAAAFTEGSQLARSRCTSTYMTLHPLLIGRRIAIGGTIGNISYTCPQTYPHRLARHWPISWDGQIFGRRRTCEHAHMLLCGRSNCLRYTAASRRNGYSVPCGR